MLHLVRRRITVFINSKISPAINYGYYGFHQFENKKAYDFRFDGKSFSPLDDRLQNVRGKDSQQVTRTTHLNCCLTTLSSAKECASADDVPKCRLPRCSLTLVYRTTF